MGVKVGPLRVLSEMSKSARGLDGVHLHISGLCRTFGARWGVGFMRTIAKGTYHNGVWAGTALGRTGGGGACVFPCSVGFRAPATDGGVGAS